MKNLTITLLTLLVLGGCVSVVPRPIIVEVSEDIDVLGMRYIEGIHTIQDIEQLKASETGGHEYLNKRVVERWEDLSTGFNLNSAEAMNIRTGKKFHIGNVPWGFSWKYKYIAYELARLNCEILTKSECVNTRTNSDGKEKIYYKDLDDYFAKIKEREEKVEQERIAERIALEKKKQEEEQKKLAVIHALKDRCISYGFTGSNNIAACVQREAQHDYELEQQKYQFQLAQQQLQATQIDEGVPWWMETLGAVAEGAAEGYKQAAIINSMNSKYQKKDIYRYCRPNCQP